MEVSPGGCSQVSAQVSGGYCLGMPERAITAPICRMSPCIRDLNSSGVLDLAKMPRLQSAA